MLHLNSIHITTIFLNYFLFTVVLGINLSFLLTYYTLYNDVLFVT